MRLFIRTLCSDRLRRMRGDEGMTGIGLLALILAICALLGWLYLAAFTHVGSTLNGR